MTDESNTHSIGGDSAQFMSDGLTLFLENGRSVRPCLRDPESNEPWMVTWSNPKDGELGFGPETDDTRVILCLGPAKAVFDDNLERVWHYEWNWWLFCDRESEPFDWQTGDVTCPHCKDEFTVSKPLVESD